jgi:hypothetical protein
MGWVNSRSLREVDCFVILFHCKEKMPISTHISMYMSLYLSECGSLKRELLSLFFFFLTLGFEFRVSHLLDRHSTHMSHSTSPTSWVFLRQGLTFCPGWPQTSILLLSASQVARITSVSHGAHWNYTLQQYAHHNTAKRFQNNLY